MNVSAELAPARERAAERWGELLRGFTIVPDALLKNQARLGLNSREMLVLLQLLTFWWKAGDWPRPRISTIARRMGVDDRTVQRAISELVKKGFVRRVSATTPTGNEVQAFELNGLLAKLNALTAVYDSEYASSGVRGGGSREEALF